MAEQSHREEMSAVIRAQRARNAVPRSLAPERTEAPPPEPEPRPEPAKQTLLGRLRLARRP
jgi:hypothetical protein